MKKLFFMVLVLCLSLQIVAQDSTMTTTTPPPATTTTTTSAPPTEKPRRFGIYAGANFANINGDADFDESSTGFNAGLMFRAISTGRLLSIWLEPGYSQIGDKYSYGTGGSQTVKLGYIMLPIMARVKTGIGLYGEIGVQGQVLVSAKNGSVDIKDEVNGFDWGIPLGLGFELRNRIGISARWFTGFTDLSKDTDKAHNSVISVRLHLLF
jgi:outer membrane immunogenic protein